MIKGLILDNFRGKTASYDFGQYTKLLGRNEAGKSTIKEALCFIFAGTDSTGRRSPTHLISTGTDGCKITLQTDKVTLSRTLTQKGSQSLAMIRDGVRVPLTQEQLSERLGASPDLFLSVFLPGYFMHLPEDKRRAVLAEVMPPIDRWQLLADILGFRATADELPGVDLSRRPDLAASKVATLRRAAAQEGAQICGQVESYQAMAAMPIGTPPELPIGVAERLAYLEHLKSAWSDFGHRSGNYERAKVVAAQTAARNQEIGRETDALLTEIKSIVDVAVPPPRDDLHAQFKELLAQQKPLPQKPASLNLPGTDRCPSCGQAVGSKHRERVQADNEAAKAEYERTLAEVKAFNEGLIKKAESVQYLLQQSVAATDAARVANQAKALKRAQLDAKVKAMAWVEPAALPPEPTPPSEPYDGAEENDLRQKVQAYHRAKGSYDQSRMQQEKAKSVLAGLKAQMAPLEQACARYEAIEAGILRIPQEELRRQSEALTIDGYTFSLEGTSVSRADGMPYAILSTGAGMRADLVLSAKLNSLMKRPTGVMFLDNADLIDLPLPKVAEQMQLFLAYVRTELPTLTIEVH